MMAAPNAIAGTCHDTSHHFRLQVQRHSRREAITVKHDDGKTKRMSSAMIIENVRNGNTDHENFKSYRCLRAGGIASRCSLC